MKSTLNKAFVVVFKTSLLLILILIIIGNMDINFTDTTIQAAFLSILGAIIAAFGAAYLTVLFTNRKEKIKEKHHLKLQTENLISILEESILPKIVLLKKNCEDVEIILESNNYNEVIFYHVEDPFIFNMDLLSIIDRYNILDILKKHKISPSVFFNLLVTMESFKQNNTLSISNDFDESRTLYYNETIKGLDLNSPKYRTEEKRFYNNMKMLKDSTSNSLKQLSSLCSKTILDITKLITLLKGI